MVSMGRAPLVGKLAIYVGGWWGVNEVWFGQEVAAGSRQLMGGDWCVGECEQV